MTANADTYKPQFWTSDADEWSNIFGRRVACKDLGLSGKALRECKKQLKEEDAGLSYREKRDRAIARKIGTSSVVPTTKPPMSISEDQAQNEQEMIELQNRMAFQEADKASKRRTGIIIGVSVGALALISFLVWFFFFRKKSS